MHYKFLWVKDLGKVIPLRLRRSTKKGCTQYSSTSRTTTGHEGDGSTTPVSTAGEPDLEASIDVSSGSSGGVSLARGASDMAQAALPSVQAIASAIPLVGAPMQAAIGGLLSCLQAIDRHNQNKADLDSLILRLNRLSCNLCNAPPACNPVEQSRRDSLVRMLQDTSAKVTTLRERWLASTPVTQAIAGCFIEIDRYLAEYLWSSLMQSQHDIHEELVILRRQREEDQKLLIAMQSLMNRTVALVGCVTLVDATGHDHAIPVNFCTSLQQLNKMLKVLFECNSTEARIQKRYVEQGQYDCCIDDGKQVIRLTNHEWSSIAAGTKIVMRVIFEQEMTLFSELEYICHFCGTVNHNAIESLMYPLKQRAGCSIDCRVCKRRFQISREFSRAKQSTQSSHSNSTGGSDEDSEMQLIRNFLVQQSITRTTFSCRWLVGDNTTCEFEGSLETLRTHIRSTLSGAQNEPVRCLWRGCEYRTRASHGMRRDSLSRHIREVHLGIKRKRI